jgi:hypothetical protein
MARSRRNTPIVPVCSSASEKQDKRFANRALRRALNVAIKTDKEDLPVIDDVSNPWAMAKDGKHYLGLKDSAKAMRK